VANGHLEPEIEKIRSTVSYAQPTQLFANDGHGRFTEVTSTHGGDLAKPRVARGAAYGDLDGDGDPDVVVSTNGGPGQLFENNGEHGNWVAVDVTGSGGNRDGIGSVVEVEAGGRRQRWLVRTGSSYLSQSQVQPILGLGSATKVESVTVISASGETQTVEAGINTEVSVAIE
jgi:hypothetical protein